MKLCGLRSPQGLPLRHAVLADEAKGAGLLSLVSDLASATASGLLGRAKGALPGRRCAQAPPLGPPPLAGRARPLHCNRAVQH